MPARRPMWHLCTFRSVQKKKKRKLMAVKVCAANCWWLRRLMCSKEQRLQNNNKTKIKHEIKNSGRPSFNNFFPRTFPYDNQRTTFIKTTHTQTNKISHQNATRFVCSLRCSSACCRIAEVRTQMQLTTVHPKPSLYNVHLDRHKTNYDYLFFVSFNFSQINI